MSQFVDLECCADVLERLDAWIDGDLGDADAAAVKNHIDQCESCRAEQSLAEAVVAELRSMPEFDVPEKVLQTVQKETRTLHEKGQGVLFEFSKYRRAPALVAVAAAVVMVVVLSQWRRPPEPQYTDREVARAVAETRLAFAYVGDVAQRAEKRFKARVLDQGAAARTVRGVQRSLRIIGEAGAETADFPVTPRPGVKGS